LGGLMEWGRTLKEKPTEWAGTGSSGALQTLPYRLARNLAKDQLVLERPERQTNFSERN
jgi:hypothetical protein